MRGFDSSFEVSPCMSKPFLDINYPGSIQITLDESYSLTMEQGEKYSKFRVLVDILNFE